MMYVSRACPGHSKTELDPSASYLLSEAGVNEGAKSLCPIPPALALARAEPEVTWLKIGQVCVRSSGQLWSTCGQIGQ